MRSSSWILLICLVNQNKHSYKMTQSIWSSLYETVPIRSLIAVLAGYFTYALLTIITIIILSGNFPSYATSSRTRPPLPWAIANLFQSFVYSGLASAVTTYLGSDIHESWIFAGILLIVGLAYLIGPKEPKPQHPTQGKRKEDRRSGWYHMSLVMASISGLLLGEHVFLTNKEVILKALNL